MAFFGRDERPTPKTQAAPVKPKVPATASAANRRETTLVARAARLEGTLTGGGDVQIEGRLDGNVSTSGRLTVAESGQVKAKLHGRVVILSGKVTGDVTADERIELKETAHLVGDITAPRVLIREGASFDGQVHMKAGDQVPAVKGRPHETSAPPNENTKRK